MRNENYYAAVEACDAEPIEMDPYDENADIKGIVSELDELIIPGGLDIQPSYYHEENVACGELDPDLDRYEMKTVEEAVKRKIPILGICRGHQLLNVFFGGSLIQNIFCCEKHKRYENKDRVHCCDVKKGCFLYEVYQSERICVNSAHHQAVKELGKGLIPVQYSQEGIIEAFYHESLPVYGVQWHPERMCLANHRDDTEDGLLLFKYFIKHNFSSKKND